MNLIFIYGPPAAGKLTVANELSSLINYPVFHNHQAIGILTDLFPHSDERLNKIRSRLSKSIRLEIFSEAAMADVSFITTVGAAGPKYFDFFRAVQSEVEAQGGKVLFVQLVADQATLMNRVGDDARKAHSKLDSQASLAQRLNDQPQTFDKLPGIEHPTIDNTNLSPRKAAQQIVDYYQL